jgi:N-acetylmuramoyl-L-alanine amidase
MSNPINYLFHLPSRATAQGLYPLEEAWWPGARAAARFATSPRDGDPVNSIEALVIHATAGSNAAGAFSVIAERRASFHWIVPGAKDPGYGEHVWATSPERRAAWHVRNGASHPQVANGSGRINHCSLGLEIVNTQKPDCLFTEWQIAATVGIALYAWTKYPRLSTIVSHAALDPARRSDPGAHFPWADFKRRVLEGCERLNDLASFGEVEARASREEILVCPVADIAQEV